jgi:GR25 family glycosyltransferase involved in LPS biosynthesis
MREALLLSPDDVFVIMEDDIYLPCDIEYENIIKLAPSDFEIIQLLVLYDGTIINLYEYFKKTKNMFIKWKYLLPSTGIYIITRKCAEKMVNQFYNETTKMFDFSSSPHQIVADVLLYETAITYATTLPYAYPLQELGSEIHPDHLSSQQKASVAIKNVLNDIQKLPFTKRMFLEPRV